MWIKDQNSERFDKCLRVETPLLKYQGFIGFSADNFDNQHISDVNINSVKIFNTDMNSYKGDEDNEAWGTIDSMPKTSADIFDNYVKNKDKFKFYNERIKVISNLFAFYHCRPSHKYLHEKLGE